MSNSTALAIIGKPAKAKDAKAEKVGTASEKIVPPVEVLHVHSALLLAAESTTGSDSKRAYYSGVFLHRREKVARIVAADGGRMFIGSFGLPTPMPSWLKDGILISSEGLKKRVQLIMGLQETPMIKLSHTKGSGFVEFSDEAGDAVFRIATMAMDYPDYERVIGAETFSSMDEDGNVKGREYEPVGINSQYLKHVGEIAKTLEAGIPKKERPKNGMVVRAYNAAPNQPMFFSFDHWPGAVLLLASMTISPSATIAKETAALMAPAIKLTLAALTAHETRNIKWAETAPTEKARAEFMAKAVGFRERIDVILGRTPSLTAIASEHAAPKPEPVTEKVATPSSEAVQEPVVEPTEDHTAAEDSKPKNQPEIKRTKIKVNRKNAA